MGNGQLKLNIQILNQGWKQFLTGRDEMLAEYDRARVHSSKRAVQAGHGNVAETAFRKWLQNSSKTIRCHLWIHYFTRCTKFGGFCPL